MINWDELTQEQCEVKFLVDKLCRLRDKRKFIEQHIEDIKNDIREIEPDNVHLTF